MKLKAPLKDEKPRKTRSFARRLTWRIILILTFINLLVVGAVLFFVFVGMFVQGEMRSRDLINLISGKMDTMLTSVEVSAANNVGELEKHLDSPEHVFGVLEKELRLNKHYMACFAAFEPNYYKTGGKWFEPYVVFRDSVTVERVQMGSASHDYFNREWYAKGLEVETGEQGYWSDPYFDEDGTQKMLCSYILPIRDRQGKKVGVFGVDIPLDWLTKLIREEEAKEINEQLVDEDEELQLERERMLYCFVTASNGQFIVHPDAKLVLKGNIKDVVEATPDTLDDAVYRDMVKGEGGMLRKIKIDGTKYYISYKKMDKTGWTMAVVQHWFTVFLWSVVISILILMVEFLAALLIFFTTHLTIWRATKPLSFLTDSAEEVAKGHFDTPLPHFKHNDEISHLRDSFETMQHSLSQYVEELKETTSLKASMESELRIAHDIQMSMLPKTFPPFPERTDLDLYGLLTPARAVGGDLYDFYIRDEKLFFCIGDVSGKGVPASLVMAVTRSLFRNISAHTARPDQIVMTLNNSLTEGNDANMFVTLFLGVLDLPTGRLRYCNAGHDAPILMKDEEKMKDDVEWSTASGKCSMLAVNANLPLGAMPGWTFSEQEIMIDAGTTIFLYTDGLTEAEDASHGLFGIERVLQVTEKSQNTPQKLITSMVDSVHQFVNGTEQSDDLTMLAIQYTVKRSEDHLDRHITLHNDVQEVPQLAEFVDEVCETVGFDASMTMQMNLAIEEAVVNVMEYAYPYGMRGEVRISALANDVRLKFIIADDGMPFDPTAQGEVDTTLSADERGIGGLGIHLVRRIMDSINYERINGQNVFTLRKRL